MNKLVLLCGCANSISIEDANSSLSIWIPAIVAIISLIVTTIFTVYIAPKISAKSNQKTAMYKICSDFFDYLTDLVSLKDFAGAPSIVRKYSLKIHLMFTAGIAPQSISDKLEKIFQLVKQRKELSDAAAITEWECKYRDVVRELRVDLSQYVGVFKPN